MIPDIGTIIAVGLSVLGGVVWLVRIEGRVTGHDHLFTERDRQANDRFMDLTARLTRIENKLDQATGLQGPPGIRGLAGPTGPTGSWNNG